MFLFYTPWKYQKIFGYIILNIDFFSPTVRSG